LVVRDEAGVEIGVARVKDSGDPTPSRRRRTAPRFGVKAAASAHTPPRSVCPVTPRSMIEVLQVTPGDPVKLSRQPLPASWTLKLADAPAEVEVPEAIRDAAAIPATVPGCVHTDLLDQDLIEDPYLAMNELEARWIGQCDWVYATRFEIAEDLLDHDRLELVFEGLDTVAVVELNGQEVGRSDNMHRRYRFDLKPAGVAGQNTLTIRFAAPQRYAEAMDAQHGPRPCVGGGSNPHLPHNMMRKMACNFGWDWGPQLLTCGVWRPAYLEAWSVARLGDVRPLITAADEQNAAIDLHVAVERIEGEPGVEVHAELQAPDGTPAAEATAEPASGDARLALRVDRPALWWPRGYGQQPLYGLRITLRDASGRTLHEHASRIGLRTSELCTDPDPQPVEGLGRGETFHLKINGKRIYCKGANWIPDDCFPHRVTPERYRRRIDQAADVHMNMLRVWGGGLYEDHAFYEHCDEIGMLVWQDFLLACACYVEEPPYGPAFEAEARDNVSRLARHPSLVLWNGCNENIWGTFDWAEDWVKIREEGRQSWGLNYYLKLFPEVVGDLAPTTPYWPGSPYSGTMDIHPNANEYGNRHIWDVWNGHGDYRNYLGHFPRFASEFGYQGPCTWATLERAVPAPQRQWLSDTMHLHNKQTQGQQRALDRIADDFDGITRDADLADVWYLASINQCRALTLGCEWFRALSPWCSGALYWQLNDCWPVTSWAAIDGDGRPKLLWHATRRFFRPRLVTVMPADVSPRDAGAPALAVYLHNDTDDAWPASVHVSRRHLDGRVLDTVELTAEVAPRACEKLRLPEDWPHTGDEFILAEVEGDRDRDRGWWFHGHDRDIAYRPPSFTTDLQRDGDQLRFTVTADVVVRDLCLLVDRLDPDARVDRGCVNLLPQESATFVIDGSPQLEEADLAGPEVLRCVNTLASVDQPA
jgi:beta-mannosidase